MRIESLKKKFKIKFGAKNLRIIPLAKRFESRYHLLIVDGELLYLFEFYSERCKIREL